MAVRVALVTILALLFLSSVFVPGHWVYAITIEEDGFQFRGPLRRPRYIHWSSITKVVASPYHDGSGESAITLRITSAQGRAWVPQHLMPYYAVVERLKGLEGFDHDAWSSAGLPENDLIRGLIGKRTVIYRRRRSGVAV